MSVTYLNYIIISLVHDVCSPCKLRRLRLYKVMESVKLPLSRQQ